MKSFRTLTLIVVVVAVLGALAVPALAAERVTTYTEDQINDSYRVTNPPRRSVTDVFVDLQPGQVVISGTITTRGQNTSSVAVTATLTPSISNGRLNWTLASATANGQTASQDLVNQINSIFNSSWRRYIKNQAPTGAVTAIEITDSEMTITRSR